MAQCPPALLATGSYDGEILVWNAVSGHIQCRFRSPIPTEHHGHAQGYVNFWSVQNAGKLLCCFKASEARITKLITTADGAVLYAADGTGFIYVYDIQNLSPDPGPPRGTFGQADSWNVRIAASWKHPAVPHEILVDPLSTPVHRLLGEDQGAVGAVDPQPADVQALEQLKPESPPLYISESYIEKELKNMCPEQHGPRLRHEMFKQNNKLPTHGGSTVYHSLKCIDIVEQPEVRVKPELLSLAGHNPFIASSTEDLESSQDT
ncbi:hypothetical protein NHX12_017064 [Muraenolepis orangiensis]|uniref:Uncharacterized protein n=1 Tax=Muraenolepis orangiensis TaxID=630683 RepID=A0A9Q0D3G8_9TELE|nr:hypothetical protein NHX12_017064 [Muraenolepis orangiensis]